MKISKVTIGRLFLLSALSVFISCTPTKKLKYVAISDSGTPKSEYFNDRSEKTIQPYDYLYIKIFSLDERTNNIFNTQNDYAYQTELLSYTVDGKGNISVPFIGS